MGTYSLYCKENINSLGWFLSPDDFKILDSNFPKKDYISRADKYWKEILNRHES